MASDRGAQTIAYSGTTTQFEDALIGHGIITKEQALLNQGMAPDAVADLLVKEQLTAQGFFDTPPVEPLTRSGPPRPEDVAEGATLEELEELEEDDEFCDASFLATFRAQRLAELKQRQARETFGTV